MELWGFNLRGLVTPKFSAPSSGETMRQTPKSFSGARTCSMSSITYMPSLVGFGFHPPPGQPKTLSFFCLSVSLFATLLYVKDCAPDFAMKAWEYRNDFDTIGYGKVCGCVPVFNYLRLLPIGVARHH